MVMVGTRAAPAMQPEAPAEVLEDGSARPALVYTNPVYAHDFPDPFLQHFGDRFFAFATQSAGHGFQVMESADLVHWTHLGTAFIPPWSSKHLWAPEVVRHRDRFYMTYSALNPRTRKHDIGIATANHPAGPFTHRSILVRGDANRYGVIDGTLFFEDDGTPYLVYSEENPRTIVIRRLTPDLLCAEGEATILIRPDRCWERGITEAPTLILRNGVYHLFFSVGWYQSSKQEACYAVCHASASSLLGPYRKSPSPILATEPGAVYGPGHQCLITLESGETWMAYHAWDNRRQPRYGSNPAGRTLRIDRLVWKGRRPVVSGPTFMPQPAPGAIRCTVEVQRSGAFSVK